MLTLNSLFLFPPSGFSGSHTNKPYVIEGSHPPLDLQRGQRKAFSSRGKRATESLPYRWTTQGIARGKGADSVLAASCTRE
ncbi:hypothetical protein YC2023_037273 [Brassica napus]